MESELILRLTHGAPLRILVIGDIMLDKHVNCEVLGLSPEDDLTPKIRVISETVSLGGAANVAVNLRKLGAEVLLVGQVGKDSDGHRVDQLIETSGIVNHTRCDLSRPTTVKTRYLTPRGRHIVRVDHEKTHESPEFFSWFSTKVDTLGALNAIVVSDYDKGVISGPVLSALRLRYNCPIVVDPKRPLVEYGLVFAITPNHLELKQYTDVDNLNESHEAKWIVMTRGKYGCSLIGRAGEWIDFDIRGREVGDPTGCGDSFVAAFTYAVVRGFSVQEACQIGNAAGAVKFDHRGVYAVSVDEIDKEMRGG